MKIIVIGDLRAMLSSPDLKIWDILFEKLPENIKEYVNNTSHIRLKTTRIYTYSLLFEALKKYFSVELPCILRGEGGKPFLKDEGGSRNIKISLSHSDGFASVFVSDEGREVGIDIQKIGASDRIDNIARRFLKAVKPSRPLSGVEIFYAELTEEGFVFREKSDGFSLCSVAPVFGRNITSDAYLRWNYAEALVKAEGGGLSSLPHLSSLSDILLTTSCRLDTEDSAYYITAASYPPPRPLDPLF